MSEKSLQNLVPKIGKRGESIGLGRKITQEWDKTGQDTDIDGSVELSDGSIFSNRHYEKTVTSDGLICDVLFGALSEGNFQANVGVKLGITEAVLLPSRIPSLNI